MKKKLEIQDFIQMQDLQEEHGIPFASAITTVIVDLINWYVQRDFDEVYIELNDLVVPQGYKNNSCIWAKQIIPRINLPQVKSYKRTGRTIIHASRKPVNPNWFKNLKDKLLHQNIIVYPTVNVPKAYQANPYLVVNRLRKIGTEIKVSQSNNQLTIIKQK